MRCSHGLRFEERCNRCVEEGVAHAAGVAMQTPGTAAPVNVGAEFKSNPINIQYAPTQGLRLHQKR
jgi:hypothetical protein